jgi:hypothetical protein
VGAQLITVLAVLHRWTRSCTAHFRVRPPCHAVQLGKWPGASAPVICLQMYRAAQGCRARWALACLLLLLLLLLLPMAAARDAHQRRIGTLSGMRRRCFSDIARASYGIRLSGVCRPSREGCRRTSRGAGTLRFAATVPARHPPPPPRASSCLDAPRGGLFAAVRIYAQRPRAANLRDRVVMGLFTRRAWGVRARVPAHQRRGDPLRHTGPSPGGTAAACDCTHARMHACMRVCVHSQQVR